MRKDLIRISKFLSLVLRHAPGRIGLTLDSEGWAEVDELLRCCESARFPLTRDALEEVVATNNKRRFAFSEDASRIRASQGHSVEVDLGLEPQPPPPFLWHGTAQRFLSGIRDLGLVPVGRRHVHLSSDRDTAEKVGSRHGKSYILRVQAERMCEDGFVFYLSENVVWLTGRVPTEYLEEDAGAASRVADIEIRRAEASEARELTAIAFAAKRYWDYPEEWIELWADELTISETYIDTNMVFCASCEQRTVGWSGFSQDDEGYWLDYCWVIPDAIGQGVGSRLVEHALALAEELGAPALKVIADPNAQGFYRKHGFKRIGECPSVPRARLLPVMEASLS